MPPKNQHPDWDDDFGYADDDPWDGEEGRGAGYWVIDDEGDKPVAVEPADDKPAEDDDAQGDDEDDDPTVYDYTDCGGEGDRFRIMNMGGSLFFMVNNGPSVIIRDEQVSDILYALIDYQDRNGEE
jgi:hypothetical protein